MNESINTLLVFSGGFALGAFFYGGLWLTVAKVTKSDKPALLMLTSFLVRTGMTVAGFYYIGAGDWLRFALCLSGFVAARFAVGYITQKVDNGRSQASNALKHEV